MNHMGGFDLSVVLARIIIRRIIIRQNGTLVLFGPSLSLKNPDSNTPTQRAFSLKRAMNISFFT